MNSTTLQFFHFNFHLIGFAIGYYYIQNLFLETDFLHRHRIVALGQAGNPEITFIGALFYQLIRICPARWGDCLTGDLYS